MNRYHHVAALLAIGLTCGAPALSGQTAGDRSYYVVADYDPTRDPFADLEMASARATAEGKRILLVVGGQWCVWCEILEQYMAQEPTVARALRRGFLLMKVNFGPKNANEAFLRQYPKIDGYPHLFVLESDGTFLHSQDTYPLEEGRSYSKGRILRFLEAWAPARE